MINKELVKRSFKKNFKTYDDNAFVQKEMAKVLLTLVPEQKYSKVFEIGSGTGFFTKLFLQHFSPKQFVANDIVAESLNYVPDNCEFMGGDIESLSFPDSIDLVVSNASIQWVSDITALLAKVYDSLSDDGLFVFSTFGPNNYCELKQVFGNGLLYVGIEELKELLGQHFEIIEISEKITELKFATFKELLTHIKLTGVNGISSKNLSVSELKMRESTYKEKFFDQSGYCLTYHPIYVSAKKKFRQNLK